MNANKKTVSVIVFSLILAGCLGFAIGSSMKRKGAPIDIENEHSTGAALEHQQQAPQGGQEAQAPTEWNTKSVDELSASLSEVMLPEDEFNKLQDAIYQTAMGLFMAQAQNSGIEVPQAAEQELKSSIEQKYSRQFFASQNANAMKELSKDELVSIMSFYNTPAGAKFLKLSPKIIEGTMTSTQNDLQQWLPATVETLVAKLKGTKKGDAPAPTQPKAPAPPAMGNEKPFQDGANNNP